MSGRVNAKWNEMARKWNEMARKWNEMARKWNEMARKWNEMALIVERDGTHTGMVYRKQVRLSVCFIVTFSTLVPGYQLVGG